MFSPDQSLLQVLPPDHCPQEDLHHQHQHQHRIILGEDYLSYDSALTSTGLLSLKARREKRELTFALKCAKHPTNSSIFPLNPSQDPHNVRKREIFQVNQAKTETYRTSTIPHLQRRLNLHFPNN